MFHHDTIYERDIKAISEALLENTKANVGNNVVTDYQPFMSLIYGASGTVISVVLSQSPVHIEATLLHCTPRIAVIADFMSSFFPYTRPNTTC